MHTVWICEICRSRVKAGKKERYGETRYYKCPKHMGGQEITLAMADVRAQHRDWESMKRRGFGTGVYMKALKQLDNETLDRIHQENQEAKDGSTKEDTAAVEGAKRAIQCVREVFVPELRGHPGSSKTPAG